MEGFEQVGGIDSMIDIEDDEEEGEDVDGAEEEQERNGEGSPKGDLENLYDGDMVIDELDKANISSHGKPSPSTGKTVDAISHTAVYSDSEHENFILECATSGKCLPPGSFSIHVGKKIVPCLGSTSPPPMSEIMILSDSNLEHGVGAGVCTPMRTGIKLLANGEKSKNIECCKDLLKSIDMVESDDEETNEEQIVVLPPEAIHVPQSDTLKRYLIDSLNQVHESEPVRSKNPKWGQSWPRSLSLGDMVI